MPRGGGFEMPFLTRLVGRTKGKSTFFNFPRVENQLYFIVELIFTSSTIGLHQGGGILAPTQGAQIHSESQSCTLS